MRDDFYIIYSISAVRYIVEEIVAVVDVIISRRLFFACRYYNLHDVCYKIDDYISRNLDMKLENLGQASEISYILFDRIRCTYFS